MTYHNNYYNKDFKKYQILNELQNLRQWIVWKIERNGGKDVKRPYMPFNTKKPASVVNRSSWSNFKLAQKAVINKQANGVGFVFTKDDPYCFIDLDHCINERGEIEPKAKRIIDMLNSYTEISQSGRGIHIIVKAKILDGSGNRSENFEIYDHGRFCAMTFNVLDGYPNTIAERQEQVDAICREIFKPKPDPEPAKQFSNEMSDHEIIEKLRNSKQGDKFSKLFFTGDISGYPSQSEADLALVNMIAFYTQEQSQIMRIIEASALYDEKWKRPDYQERTINKALYQLRNTYSNNNTILDENHDKYFKSPKKQTFIPKSLADDITSKFHFIYVSGILYIYLDGVWKPTGESLIRRLCREKLGSESRVNRVNEVIAHVQDMNFLLPECLNTYKELINMKNGMLNWKTKEFMKHNKDYLSTIQIPITYDPDADSSKIADWLESTLGDPELITLALELFGYCMIPDTTMAKAFMLVGSGANGKSTFIKVLERFLGHENVSNVPLQELSENRFKRAELFGKLVNMFADLDTRLLESTTYFKTIVSGDTIDAERKNRDPFSFTPFSRLVFSANQIPGAKDRSYAYYRRWIIIPFEKKFEGSNENKNILNELCNQQNMSALFNNALYALNQLMEYKEFTTPQKVKKALLEYEKQNDPIRAFIEEFCQFDVGSKIERGELYNALCRYCSEEGSETPTRNSFYQFMRTYKEIREKRDGSGRFFEGIRLKS